MLRFILWWLALQGIVLLPWIAKALEFFFLSVSHFFLWTLFPAGNWMIEKNVISIGTESLILAKECTAASIYVIFMAFSLAWPCDTARWRSMLLGLGALVMINILRLIALFAAAIKTPGLMDVLHDLLWPLLFFLAMIRATVFFVRRTRLCESSKS